MEKNITVSDFDIVLSGAEAKLMMDTIKQ